MKEACFVVSCLVEEFDGAGGGGGDHRAIMTGKELRRLRREAQIAVLAGSHDQQLNPFLVNEFGLLP